jgi:hypothetical protein
VVFSLGSLGAVVVDKSSTGFCSLIGGGGAWTWGIATSNMRAWTCFFIMLAMAFFVAWTGSSGKVGAALVIVAWMAGSGWSFHFWLI